MNFEWALENLKIGHAVCRKGWNGKNLFVYAVFKHQSYSPFFILQNIVTGNRNTWVPSVSDLFANDWEEKIAEVLDERS